MTAPFPARILPHDPELDRLLALASTPQAPADLAARIVGDVTRLPQQAAAPRAAERSAAAGRQQSRQRLRAAGFAAVVLITGTAVALLTRGGTDDEPLGIQVAAIDRPAPATVAAPPSAPAPGASLAPADSPAAAPGLRRTHAPDQPAAEQPRQAVVPSPLASEPLRLPPATELADEAPTVVGEHKNPAGLADNGPVDPGSSVGPLGPPPSTYGPPAGFGISGSGGLPMPEGSSAPSSSAPRGGRPGGPQGGPFHR